MLGTDMEVPVSDGQVHSHPSVESMSDRELLEESVRNQRFLMSQFGQVASMFQDIHQKVAEGGIAGLMKGLMGRG